jgi:hypothetical protein
MRAFEAAGMDGHRRLVMFVSFRQQKVLTSTPGIQERHSVTLGIRNRTDVEADVGGLGRALRGSVVVLFVSVALVACSDSGVDVQPGVTTPGSQPTTAPRPSASIDPQALPAVRAYEAFQKAANNAQRKPVSSGEDWPAGADFTKFSFDPIKTAYVSYVWGLEAQGVEFRGTPDTPHITVAKINLKASPWPTVLLKDCPTGGDWQEYSIKTGKRVPSAEDPDVPPPYWITAKMIFYKQHWGLHSTTVDKSRTCTP